MSPYVTVRDATRIARIAALNASETKKKSSVENETTVNALAAPHYITLDDDAFKLTQGDGYSNMTGHEVNGVALDSAFYLRNNGEPVFVKVYLLYSKTGVIPGVGGSHAELCESNTGDSSLSNNVLDLGLRINHDFFSVLKTWELRLAGGTTAETFDNLRIIRHFLNFRGRKFRYNGTNTYPCNGRYFYVIMPRRADNDGTGATDLEISSTSTFYFKDP